MVSALRFVADTIIKIKAPEGAFYIQKQTSADKTEVSGLYIMRLIAQVCQCSLYSQNVVPVHCTM